MDDAAAVDESPAAREDLSTASIDPMDPAILHEYLEKHGKQVPDHYHYLHTAKRNWPGRFTDEDICAICQESLNSGYTPNYSALSQALDFLYEDADGEDDDDTSSDIDPSRAHIVIDWFSRIDPVDPAAPDTDVNGDGNDDPFPLIPYIGLLSRANEPRFLHPTFTDDRILTCAFGHAYHARCLFVEIHSPRTDDRALQDRCPVCRRRLFADTARIENRIVHYGLRYIIATLFNGPRFPTPGGIFRHRETDEVFRMLPLEQYERVTAAWSNAHKAFEQGDVGLFSAAMDEAERIDDEVQELEQRFEDDSEDTDTDTDDEADVQDEGD